MFDRKSDCERKKPACRPSETRLTSDQWPQEPLRTQPRFCMKDLEWEDKLLLNTFNGSWSNISLSSAVPHTHQTRPQIHNWVSSFCFILKRVEHHREPPALLVHTRLYLMTCDALSHSMQYPAFGKVNVRTMSMHICSPACFYWRTWWEMNHISVSVYFMMFLCVNEWMTNSKPYLFTGGRFCWGIWYYEDLRMFPCEIIYIWWIL